MLLPRAAPAAQHPLPLQGRRRLLHDPRRRPHGRERDLDLRRAALPRGRRHRRPPRLLPGPGGRDRGGGGLALGGGVPIQRRGGAPRSRTGRALEQPCPSPPPTPRPRSRLPASCSAPPSAPSMPQPLGPRVPSATSSCSAAGVGCASGRSRSRRRSPAPRRWCVAGLVPDLTAAPTSRRACSGSAPALGGLLFGHGMVLAGGCAGAAPGAARRRQREGAARPAADGAHGLPGDERPARLRHPRAARGRQRPPQHADQRAGCLASLAAVGLGATPARLLATLLLLAPLLAFCLADPKLRRSRADLATGQHSAPWWQSAGSPPPRWATPRPLLSLTFVGPAGSTLLWLMAGDGQLPGFGTAVVLGAILGSAAAGRR